MNDPGLIGQLDVAILCVAAFFLFFLGLVYHLRQEDKREGYPLEIPDAVGNLRRTEGFPPIPQPKTFDLPHGGGTVRAPDPQREDPTFEERRIGLDGFPVDPTRDPLESGRGAAAWSRVRADRPDLNVEGEPKIVPLSKWDEYYVAPGDPDPRGYDVVSAEGRPVGRVTDLWFNRAEFFLRYLEFEIEGEERTRMLPLFFCKVSPAMRQVRVMVLSERDLRRTPVTGSPDVITVLEEDRLNAWYAGGYRFSAKATA